MPKLKPAASFPPAKAAKPVAPASELQDSAARSDTPEYRRTTAQLLWRNALSCPPVDGEAVLGVADDSRPEPEDVVPRGRSIPSAEELKRATDSVMRDGETPDRSVRWRRAGWVALGLAAISMGSIGVAKMFPVLLQSAPIERQPDTQSAASNLGPNIPAPAAEPDAESDPARTPVQIEPQREVHTVDMNPTSSVISPTPPPMGVADGSDAKFASALALLPEGMPPRVLIRYLGSSAEARRRAESLAKALAGNGVEVADVRESAAVSRTELSFSYAPDKAIAQQIGRLAGVTPTRAAPAKEDLMARPGIVQLSISGR